MKHWKAKKNSIYSTSYFPIFCVQQLFVHYFWVFYTKRKFSNTICFRIFGNRKQLLKKMQSNLFRNFCIKFNIAWHFPIQKNLLSVENLYMKNIYMKTSWDKKKYIVIILYSQIKYVISLYLIVYMFCHSNAAKRWHSNELRHTFQS